MRAAMAASLQVENCTGATIFSQLIEESQLIGKPTKSSYIKAFTYSPIYKEEHCRGELVLDVASRVLGGGQTQDNFRPPRQCRAT